MNILHVVGGLPSEDNPHIQPFIKSQIDSLKLMDINIEVMDLKGYKSSINYLSNVKEIRRVVLEKKIDLIHAHYTYCGLSVLLANTRLPIILSLLGSDLQGAVNPDGRITLRGKVDKIFTKIISGFVNLVIVKSVKMKEILNSKTQIKILPNGVDFSVFQPADNLKCRKELNLKPDFFYPLFLANSTSHVKNFRLAEQSINLFRRKYNVDNVELITVYGLPQKEIVKFLNACNVLIFTSFWEGSPNVVKEAMACNLPVISVDVGDVKEVITGTKNCFIVPYNPENIAEKLNYIYTNRERSNGRERISHLRSDVIAKRLIEIYENCIQSHISN